MIGANKYYLILFLLLFEEEIVSPDRNMCKYGEFILGRKCLGHLWTSVNLKTLACELQNTQKLF